MKGWGQLRCFFPSYVDTLGRGELKIKTKNRQTKRSFPPLKGAFLMRNCWRSYNILTHKESICEDRPYFVDLVSHWLLFSPAVGFGYPWPLRATSASAQKLNKINKKTFPTHLCKQAYLLHLSWLNSFSFSWGQVKQAICQSKES